MAIFSANNADGNSLSVAGGLCPDQILSFADVNRLGDFLNAFAENLRKREARYVLVVLGNAEIVDPESLFR